MKIRRSALSFIAVVFLTAAIAVYETFEYAAAPTNEKQSNYVFPRDAQPAAPASFIQPPTNVSWEQTGGFANDASHLNRTAIYGIVRVTSEEDVSRALNFARTNGLRVSCAGRQHSMGGQTFTAGGVVLDMNGFNQVVVDKERKTFTAQAGARWADVQELLDREGLAVKSMQSINIFTIGGSLSVNGHGIDPNPGSIAPTVRAIRIMLADGAIVRATPSDNAELFRHAIGGYGLFGVILDAEFNAVTNETYRRDTVYMDYRDFADVYRRKVEGNCKIGLAFARLSIAPRSYLRETALHIYAREDFAGSLPPLKPAQHTTVERFVINFSKTGELGRWLRWNLEKRVEPALHQCVFRNQALNPKEPCIVSRNAEMYDDMAYLRNRLSDTDILQEYFVPHDKFAAFVDSLRETVTRNGANLLNVTVRVVSKDEVTALPYAKSDVFALVLYFNVKFNDQDNQRLQRTTSELIDAAEHEGGTFYLPYQLFYSEDQLRRAYPDIDKFFATKKKYDPAALFSNRFYQKYAN